MKFSAVMHRHFSLPANTGAGSAFSSQQLHSRAEQSVPALPWACGLPKTAWAMSRTRSSFKEAHQKNFFCCLCYHYSLGFEHPEVYLWRWFFKFLILQRRRGFCFHAALCWWYMEDIFEATRITSV